MTGYEIEGKGTYTLVLHLSDDTNIEVGALGSIEFDEGYYTYTGSAFGTGGLKRVERHRRVSTGENDTRQWHIDHLNGNEESSIHDAVVSLNVDVECEVSSLLREKKQVEPVENFGASDCDCSSHLVYFDSPPTNSVVESHRQASRDTGGSVKQL
ncbi:MAG: GIY-YIG nuclease family protein [Halobacteria archaeon]|nr:GIY-YIG nuclease family protein [Halobacteria archaeon]